MPISVAGFVRRIREAVKGHTAFVMGLGAFLLLGVYLLSYILPERAFSEEGLIYDMIWLDAWSLSFILLCVVLWLSHLTWRTKALIGVLVLGIYGFIEIGLILNGTPFSSNAYWGDQKFRQAMILKFMEFGYPTDYYYKDLPPFYPPLLYLAFAGIGKVLSLPAYYLLKIGGMLIFLCGPLLLHWLWRPLVGSVRSWLIVVFTFLICAGSYPFMLSAPHAFVAISVFIPWWLRYVENQHGHKSIIRHWFFGGMLGAIIISTYYYPLFVGLFLLAIRASLGRRFDASLPRPTFQWKRAIGVGVTSAVFSAWYWVPILWSARQGEFNPSIAQWHHIDSTSLQLAFTSFSWTGLLFLAGIIFSLCRWQNTMHRSLLFLVGVTFPYLFIGSILGALDHPINLIKARQMLTVFGGPFVGFLVVTWLRNTVRSKLRWAAPVLTILALTMLCDHFSNYAKSGMVKTARTAYAPAWGTDPAEMNDRSGSVFLCGHETFPSFFPVYTFLAANEHYSHPASQFKKRYDLLDLLEKVDDPRVINIALRANRYDKVDFFMPHRDGSVFDITVSLSNYPNKYYTRIFKFPDTLVKDTSLFRRLKGDDLFEVLTPVAVPLAQARHILAPGTDTLVQLMRLAIIRDRLTPEGQTELDVHTQADWSRWRRPPEAAKATVLGDSVVLKDLRVVNAGDSLHLLIAFEALETLSRQFKVMVHLFVDDQMSNFDFSPVPATNTWQRYATVLCHQTIPNPGRPFRLYIGMFDRSGNLPGVLQLDSSPEPETSVM